MPHNLSADKFFAGISKPRNLALMKIFSDLDIVDYTNHGVPTIVDYYGKDIFNIQENYILVTILFNEEVLSKIDVGVNVGVNDVEKRLLRSF